MRSSRCSPSSEGWVDRYLGCLPDRVAGRHAWSVSSYRNIPEVNMVAKLNTRFTALKVLSLTALVFALPAAEAFAGSTRP